MVKLLEKGADPNSKDNNGYIPLVWAVVKGHKAVVKLLLEKGIDPNSKDKFARTLLGSGCNRRACDSGGSGGRKGGHYIIGGPGRKLVLVWRGWNDAKYVLCVLCVASRQLFRIVWMFGFPWTFDAADLVGDIEITYLGI